MKGALDMTLVWIIVALIPFILAAIIGNSNKNKLRDDDQNLG